MSNLASSVSNGWGRRILGAVGRFILGTIAGLIPGIIVGEWAADHLVQTVANEPPVAPELRYDLLATRICLGFELAFGVAFVVGNRLRLPAAFGAVALGVLGGVAIAVIGALLIALIRDEFPFNHNKVASDQTLRWARTIVVPLFGAIGGMAGFVHERRQSRNRR